MYTIITRDVGYFTKSYLTSIVVPSIVSTGHAFCELIPHFCRFIEFKDGDLVLYPRRFFRGQKANNSSARLVIGIKFFYYNKAL